MPARHSGGSRKQERGVSAKREELIPRKAWLRPLQVRSKTRENPILSQGKSHPRLRGIAANSQLALSWQVQSLNQTTIATKTDKYLASSCTKARLKGGIRGTLGSPPGSATASERLMSVK